MLKSPRRNLLVWLLGASCALSAGAQGYKEELTPFLTRVDPQEWLFRTNIALSANNLAPANDGPLLTDVTVLELELNSGVTVEELARKPEPAATPAP